MKRSNGEFKLSTKWIQEKYYIFNDEIFEGVLPDIDFGLSSSARHAGWARYKKSLIFNEITPLKILLSSFLNPTEKIATNTLLHEMIHIADYTLHPEHFFDDSYDSHTSDFFQGWMEKINSMGYWVTVSVDHEENNEIKAETAKKNRGKEAIAILAKWRGESGNYDIAWTERKYIPNVIMKNSSSYYTTLIFCNFKDTGDMLVSKECKGKLMRGNIISSGEMEKYCDKLELPGFMKVNVDELLLSNDEKTILIRNVDTVTDEIMTDIENMFDNLKIGTHINGNGHLSISSDFLYKNGKTYWVAITEVASKTSLSLYKGTIIVHIPMSRETSARIREEYEKRKNGNVYSLYKIMNNVTREIEDGFRDIKTIESIMTESRNRRLSLDVIVEEKIKDFVDRQTDKTDDSIVNVKELGDGTEIITQW